MNEAFSQLLSAVKNGAKNGAKNGNGNGNGIKNGIPHKLKIGEHGPITGAQHTINQINAQDWTWTDDGALILNNPDKKNYYQMVVGAGGSRTKANNLLRDDVNLFQQQDSISRVNLMGESRVGKPKVGADKIAKLSQVGLNRETAYQQSLARGEAWRSMPHIEGTVNNRKAVADMKRLGEMFPNWEGYTHDNFIKWSEWNKDGLDEIDRQIRLANAQAKELGTIDPKTGKIAEYTKGHGKAASKGGPMTARNLWLELSSDNYGRQAKDEAPTSLFEAIGIDTSYYDSMAKYFGLVPKTEAEMLMTDDDIIESLASFEWETVLERRKAQIASLRQVNN